MVVGVLEREVRVDLYHIFTCMHSSEASLFHVRSKKGASVLRLHEGCKTACDNRILCCPVLGKYMNL